MRKTAEEIARALGNGKERQSSDGAWVTICPAHDDRSPSLSISESDGKILVSCHAGCSQESVIDALRDRDLWQSKQKVWKVLPHAPEGYTAPKDFAHYKFGKPSRRWEYKNRKGRLVGYIYRFDHEDGSKDLVPLSWCRAEETGETAWRWKSFQKPRPIYGEDLIDDNKDKIVVVVEGEKATDAARLLLPEFLVVSWPGGSNAITLVDWEKLKNRDIVIWPDSDKPGFKAASRFAEILHDIGMKSIKIVMLPKNLPKGWDLADEIPSGVSLDPKTLVLTAVEFTPSGDAVMDEMNREFALTVLGDKAIILWERWDQTLGRMVTKYVAMAAIKAKLANKFVPVGRKEVPIFDYWLSNPARRTYDGVVFEPGLEMEGQYNLWRGFRYTPEKHGDWSILREHILQNVASGDESLNLWVLGWFAQMFQNPRVKPGTSIALRGKQGTGKTIVGKNMGALIRDNYVYVDDPRYVVGNFNSHMGHALLLQADEGFFAGDPRHSGRLKGLVTSETNRIEHKGKESFEINNYLRLLVSSNHDWVVPTALEERRFAIIDVGNDRLQDRAYFKSLEDQLLNGGYEGLLHYLLNMDLSTIDIGVIPKTNALFDQKELSLDLVTRYWFERIRDGEITGKRAAWPSYVGTEEIYVDFIDRCQMWGITRRPADTVFGKELKKLMPPGSLDRSRVSIDSPTDGGYVSKTRKWCYNIPDLDDARLFFQAIIGYDIDWNDGDAELKGL